MSRPRSRRIVFLYDELDDIPPEWHKPGTVFETYRCVDVAVIDAFDNAQRAFDQAARALQAAYDAASDVRNPRYVNPFPPMSVAEALQHVDITGLFSDGAS